MSFGFNSDNTLLYQQSLLNHFSKIKPDTVYVLKCSDIDLPSKIGKHIIIDISENVNALLKNTSSLFAVKLMPVEVNKETLEITLIDFILKNGSNRVIMNNAGSVVYSYKYDSRIKKYKLLKKTENTI
jgi:hypothetical protein